MNYAESLASRLLSQNLETEDCVMSAAYDIACDELGHRRAAAIFNYDKDFLADLISAYFSAKVVDQRNDSKFTLKA